MKKARNQERLALASAMVLVLGSAAHGQAPAQAPAQAPQSVPASPSAQPAVPPGRTPSPAELPAAQATAQNPAQPQLDPASAQTPAAPATEQPSATDQPPSAPAAPPVQAAPAVTAASTGGTVHGFVKAGTVPLPGVSVTATNTLTGKKYTTSTDVTGAYQMAIPARGRYVIRAELAAFASATQEVRITPETTDLAAEFSLDLASRAAARDAADASGGTRAVQAIANALGRGTQSLSIAGGEAAGATDATTGGGGNAGVALPSLGGLGGDNSVAAGDSVAVSGAQGQTNGLANLDEDEIRRRVEEAMSRARQQGGASQDQTDAVVSMIGGLIGGGGFSRGGGGRGGRGGGGGGGGFRNFNPTQPHGAIFYSGGNSALDAAPFSLSNLPVANPGYNKNSFGVTIAGSPYLPGLTKPNPKQFVFLNVTGTRNTNPVIFNATVPTLTERTGDFRDLTQTVSDPVTGVATVLPVPIYDPLTGQPFPNNVIPQNRLNPQALALLNYYLAPNVPGSTTQTNNYQQVTTAAQNTTAASFRFVRNFGQQPAFGGFGGVGFGGGGGRRGGANANAPATLRQNINFGGSYTHSAADQRNLFPELGGATASNGLGINTGYTIGYGRFTNNFSVNFNRSHATTRNYMTNTGTNPDAPFQASANPLIAANPFFSGVPSLQIANYDGLSETRPNDSIGQTLSVSDFISYSHKKHNMRFGADFRRVHSDSIGGTDVLGSLTFTGYATQAPQQSGTVQQAPSGAGFADFLLGLPQRTSIQAGLNKTYLRQNVFDAYAQDDWRVLPRLTLNLGLRYEYFSPFTEKNNRLVNLDHNANFTAVTAVQPNQQGPYTGGFNAALINPDRTLFSPRLGFAFRPRFLPKVTRDLVIRGGYGMNYNTGQYGIYARQLAFQPPFALTQTNLVNQQGCTPANLNLGQAFGCSSAPVQNNYAVNRNYRLGHVQAFNLDVQRTLPLNTVLNIGYNGSLGGNLDIVRAPNRTAVGLLDPNAASFLYADSLGFQRLNNLAVSLRKRQQKGIGIAATYTFAHSIDNASSVGGQGNVVAQNDLDLNAEEGNSFFVTRHHVNGNWVIELPFGPNRAFFNKDNAWSKVFDGFIVSGNYNFQSGMYYTPNYLATVNQTSTGVTNSRRPNRNFAAPISGAGRFLRGQQKSANVCPQFCFFNTAAFTDPGNNFGTASRGSIEGPGIQSIDASLSRNFRFGDTKNLEARITAFNPFNTVQYTGINTTLNSPTFGQVTSVASRRRITFTARYRF